MFNLRDRQLLIGIGAGIIASIFFVYFLDPILTFIGNSSIILMSFLYQSLIDGVYQDIAEGKPELDYYILFLFGSSLFIFCTIIPVFIVKKIIFPNQDAKKQETKENIIQKIRKQFYLVLSLSFFNLMVWVVLMGVLYIEMKAVREFNQVIKILAPYLNTIQEKKIISKFSSMQSANDYVLLNEELLDIINRQKIPIPERIIKSIENKVK